MNDAAIPLVDILRAKALQCAELYNDGDPSRLQVREVQLCRALGLDRSKCSISYDGDEEGHYVLITIANCQFSFGRLL